ncbi:MAG: hypothetical protein MUQ10_19585 [Anaerolineae bacterium]|nr:hypothetical protein [Anaerolineae bacterium]
MRAIYTTWSHVIDWYPESSLGPAGVYVNMSFSRDSQWGQVVSFVPREGRLTVKTAVKDTFFLRPPHWAPRGQVKAFVGAEAIPVQWSGDYVRFSHVEPCVELTIVYPLMRFTQEVGGIWKEMAPNVDLRYEWLGNMVISADPPAEKSPIFSNEVRVLPNPPEL